MSYLHYATLENTFGYSEEELVATQTLLDIAWAYRGTEGHRPDVCKDSLDTVNAAGQKLCLRKAGTERADGTGWNLTETQCDRVLAAADVLGLRGGTEPEGTSKIDLAVILGAAEPTVRKRIADAKKYFEEHPEVSVEKIVASGSERKLWTFDAKGNEKEPMVFHLLAKQMCKLTYGVYEVDLASEYEEAFRTEARTFFETACQNGEGVKDISEKTSQYFKEKYDLSWPTESDMIGGLLVQEPLFRGKVATLTAGKNTDGGRATTDQNAESIKDLVKKGDHVMVVSNGSFGVYQGLVFQQKLGKGGNLHVLASRMNPPETLEEKQKQVQEIMDSLGRGLYATLKLYEASRAKCLDRQADRNPQKGLNR